MILFIGKNGQLAKAFQKALRSDQEAVFLSHEEANLESPQSIEQLVLKYKPEIIINCGAYTNVEQAEDSKELAYKINTDGIKALGALCEREEISLIHFSTDYVFNGEESSPYPEDFPTSPINVYGETKLHGEEELLKLNLKGAIFRTSWLYFEESHNFLTMMLKLSKERDLLKIVGDQIGSPTYCGDLVNWVLDSLSKTTTKKMELYHLSHLGETTWYDFASYFFKLTETKIETQKVTSSEFPTKAKRPMYSVLSKNKFQTHYPEIQLSSWEEGVQRCLKKLSS